MTKVAETAWGKEALRLMAFHGLSVVDLAGRMQIHKDTVRQLLRDLGTRNHHVRTLSRLAMALNQPGDYFLGIEKEG